VFSIDFEVKIDEFVQVIPRALARFCEVFVSVAVVRPHGIFPRTPPNGLRIHKETIHHPGIGLQLRKGLLIIGACWVVGSHPHTYLCFAQVSYALSKNF
jgi:hypothetical protein